MALISYNSTATVLTGEHSGNTYADTNDAVDAALRPVADEKALLKAEINALKVDTSKAAYCENALYYAKQIFQNGNSTVPDDRPRIVILLSAGVFGPSGTLESSAVGDGKTAMDMIWLSFILKTERGQNLEPNFNSNFYGFADRTANEFSAAYGSYDGCGATVYCVGLGMPTTVPSGAYYTTTTGTIASRINEVMYRVSSHRPDGTHVNSNMYNSWESWIEDPSNNRGDDWEGTYPDKLTRNVNELSTSYTSYFLTADDTDELTNIFATISDSITTGGASIELKEETKVVDVVSDYFTLPADADTDDINVYMADCTNVDTSGDETEYSWGSRSQLWPTDEVTTDDISVQVTLTDGDTVSVTGFDYSENWVGTDSQTGAHGKKLIIEFKVYVSDDFLGGDKVPTNASGSHVESGDGEVFEDFELPTVDIDVDTSEVDLKTDITTNDFNAYLTKSVDLNEIIEIPAASIFDGTNNAYVDVVFTITDASDNEIGTYTIYAGNAEMEWEWATGYANGVVSNLLEDQTYTITCTVGDEEEPVSGSSTAHIYVYKPVVTFQDSTIYLSQTPDYELVDTDGTQIGNYQGVVWKHGTVVAGTEMGTAPELTYTYAPAEATFTSCTTVNVTDVTIDDKVVNGENLKYVTFVNGENKHNGNNEVGEFTVHVLKPTFVVNTRPLWADYAADVDLKQGIEVTDTGYDVTAEWDDACDEPTPLSDAPIFNTAEMKDSLSFTFDIDTDGIYPMGAADVVAKVNSVTWTYGDGANDSITTTFVDDTVASKPAFTIYVNKFDLTINKTWDNVEECYKQDVIFTVTGNYGTGEKSIQVVIPKGQTSVTVVGLLCGQSYTVAEANSTDANGVNWAWRFVKPNNQTVEKVAHGVTTYNPHKDMENQVHLVEKTFENSSPFTKWFDALANAFNIFNKGGNN